MRAGEEDATGTFAGFFRDNHRRVYAFALHLTGNREDALDVVQEAWLCMHQRWGQ